MGKVKKVGIWSEPVVSVVRGPGSVVRCVKATVSGFTKIPPEIQDISALT